MKLRRKTLLIFLVTAVCLAAAIFFSSRIIFKENFINLEKEHYEAHVESALYYIEEEIKDLNQLSKDWSTREEIHQITKSPESEKKKDFLCDTCRTLKLNVILFVDPGGNIISGSGFDLQNGKAMPCPQGLLAVLLDGGRCLYFDSPADSYSGIIPLEGNPMIISSRPLVDDEDQGRICGALVMGRFFKRPALESFSRSNNLSLEICGVDDQSIPPDARGKLLAAPGGKEIVFETVDAGITSGFTLIRDIYGKAGLALRTDIPRDIYSEGLNMAYFMIFSVVILVTAFILVSVVMVNNMVIARVTGLITNVKYVKESSDLSQRVLVDGKDELADLAEEINGLLDVIEHSERKIHEERRQLISIFDSINQPVYVSDPESYEVLYCNRFAGAEWGDMVGKKCYRVLQNLDAPCLFCTNKYIFGENTGQAYVWEYQNRINKRWYCCVDKAIYWPDGRLVRSEIAFDIHDRKMAEKSLQMNEARLQALLELNKKIDSPMKDITCFATEEGVKLTHSKIGYLAFVNEDETVLEMHSWSDSARDQCTVKNKKRFYQLEKTGLWGETVRQRKPMIINDYSVPNKYKKGVPEGHPLLTRSLNIPVFDGDRIVAVAGVANKEEAYEESDLRQLNLLMNGMWRLIQRKLAKQQLKDSEEKYRAIVDYAPVGVTIHNGSEVLFINSKAREILKYSRDDDLIGRNIKEFVYKDDHALMGKTVLRRERDEYTPDYELRLICKDNELKQVYVGAKTFKYNNEFAHMVSFADISELKRAEEALKKAKEDIEKQNEELRKLDKIKNGLIRDVTHELRTPVAKYAMQLEILKGIMKEHGLDKETAKVVGVMESSVKRQDSVIRNILDLSRLESGGRKHNVASVRLDKVIKEVVDDYKSSFKANNIKVKTNTEPVSVMTDEEMLWHVFSNIISNAVKFRSVTDPPEIVVSMEKNEREVVVIVSDNGIGLTEEEKARAFDRLYKADASVEGSGVGLSIAKVIAEELGADIWIESEGRGKGVTVGLRITLDWPFKN